MTTYTGNARTLAEDKELRKKRVAEFLAYFRAIGLSPTPRNNGKHYYLRTSIGGSYMIWPSTGRWVYNKTKEGFNLASLFEHWESLHGTTI